MSAKKKRKSTTSPAKKSAAAKKAARTRKAKADAMKKQWNKTYGPEEAAPPKAEPETVYDYAIQTGRR